MSYTTDDWTGCYDLGYGNLLVPAAYSHPAKMSRNLVFKIIAHALEEGWIQPGQWILDPFGGVGTTALPSLMAGLNYIGVELESKFVELGRQNIELWNSKFASMPKWTGQATLLQGDSRRLAEVIQGAGMVVGSPPYVDVDTKGGRNGGIQASARHVNGKNHEAAAQSSGIGYGTTPGQLATLPPGSKAVISSPPFAGNSGGRGEASRNGIDAALFDRHSGGMKKGTGSDPANLDHLPQGQPPTVIISSPPYAEGEKGHPSLGSVNKDAWGKDGRDIAGRRGVDGAYGASPGQLGAMKAGELAVVGSPPFENSMSNGKLSEATIADLQSTGHKPGPAGQSADYGQAPGQLGSDSGETFWIAAALIVQQCALILPVGGTAIWVTKRYVKDRKIVDFSQQWAALCEACGFEVVHWHRAMLVKDGGNQADIFGNDHKKTIAKKSFFRRLAEKNGSPPIDWEDVICMRKRANQPGEGE